MYNDKFCEVWFDQHKNGFVVIKHENAFDDGIIEFYQSNSEMATAVYDFTSK